MGNEVCISCEMRKQNITKGFIVHNGETIRAMGLYRKEMILMHIVVPFIDFLENVVEFPFSVKGKKSFEFFCLKSESFEVGNM